MMSSELAMAIISLVSLFIGAAAKAVGDRIRALTEEHKLAATEREQERARQVSERDYWQKIATLDHRVEQLSQAVQAAKQESAALQVQVAVLQRENEQIRLQYRDLSERYDKLRAAYMELSQTKILPDDLLD